MKFYIKDTKSYRSSDLRNSEYNQYLKWEYCERCDSVPVDYLDENSDCTWSSIKDIRNKVKGAVETFETICDHWGGNQIKVMLNYWWKSERPYIEINSLEELLEFKKNVGEELILTDSNSDYIRPKVKESTLEIYDGYRE